VNHGIVAASINWRLFQRYRRISAIGTFDPKVRLPPLQTEKRVVDQRSSINDGQNAMPAPRFETASTRERLSRS
jgi:hypothetical protein